MQCAGPLPVTNRVLQFGHVDFHVHQFSLYGMSFKNIILPKVLYFHISIYQPVGLEHDYIHNTPIIQHPKAYMLQAPRISILDGF